MGDEGTLQMSESPAKCRAYSEGRLVGAGGEHPWDKWAKKGYVVEMKAGASEEAADNSAQGGILAMYGASPAPATWLLPVEVEDDYHRPHLKNFFDSIRGEDELNCPPEIGYETAVAVLNVNKAVAAGKRIDLAKSDFTA
jgi:hypothetical protein